MVGIGDRALVRCPQVLRVAEKKSPYHDRRKNGEVENGPDAVVEEPLILPEGVQSLLGDEIGEEAVVESRKDHHHDDDVAKFQENLQLGGLLLFFQILDRFHQRLQNREIDERIDQRREN